MNDNLLSVAFSRNALYLPSDRTSSQMSVPAAGLLVFLRQHGYTVDEDCLHHLNALDESDIKAIYEYVAGVFKTNANWAALTRDWTMRPTGVTIVDYIYTALVNQLPHYQGKGVELPCGHFIPEGTFDLSRYTGCPYCGTQFETAPALSDNYDTKRTKILTRWSLSDAEAYADSLLAMPVPPDASKAADLKALLHSLPQDYFDRIGDIACIETRVITASAAGGAAALRFLKEPSELLRMLWYNITDNLIIERPKTVKERYFTEKMREYGLRAGEMTEKHFRLHYSRSFCGVVARWFEALPMTAGQICQNMHGQRQMWVRFIRALRLNDYARRYALPRLTEVLDRFYRQDYSVWGGEVEAARQSHDNDRLFSLLCERPGAFARCLYDTIVDFGADATLEAFARVADRLPVRLLVSLANGATAWFLPDEDHRFVHLPKGNMVKIPLNPGLKALSAHDRADIATKVQTMVLTSIYNIYASRKPLPGDRVFIDPELWTCPVPVGDRGKSVNNISYAVPGQIFRVEGDKVRLFLHWGVGMSAQHYDMDLSCALVGERERLDIAYYNLNTVGALHSGDIQCIPDKVGAAEYIELDLPKLIEQGYDYAIFAANAYSVPRLASDMIVGWMSSEQPMKTDNDTGVAYNPAYVQQLVSVAGFKASRGMIFGILDIVRREILWCEMANDDQRLNQLDHNAVKALRKRLEAKIKIGELIAMRAQSHNQTVTTSSTDKSYTLTTWPEADIL